MYAPSRRTTWSCSPAPSTARERRSTYRCCPRQAITSSLPVDPSSVINGASVSSAVSRSTRVARRSGCSKASTRTSPLSEPIAGSPGSSSFSARPLRATSHSRGDFPCQPPTTARTVAEMAQTKSRARSGESSESAPSNAFCPAKTITPAGGSSGSAAVFAKASSTADSRERSALITRRVGEPNRSMKSLAISSVSAPSVNTNQLPSGSAEGSGPTGVEVSTQVVSKIFCVSGNGTVRGCTRWRKMPVSSAVGVPASSVRMTRPIMPAPSPSRFVSSAWHRARRPTSPNTRMFSTDTGKYVASTEPANDSAGKAAARHCSAASSITGWIR